MANTIHYDARDTLANLRIAIATNDAATVKICDRELQEMNDTYMYLLLTSEEFESFCRLGA